MKTGIKDRSLLQTDVNNWVVYQISLKSLETKSSGYYPEGRGLHQQRYLYWTNENKEHWSPGLIDGHCLT